MITTVVLLVILIVLASLFGGSGRQHHRRKGNSKGYSEYDEIRQQREHERAFSYLERQRKKDERDAKRHGVGFSTQQMKSPILTKNKRRFK